MVSRARRSAPPRINRCARSSPAGCTTAASSPSRSAAGIRQLAPAELAVWEGGRLRLQRYWHLSFPERRLAAADAAVLVRDQARDAIRLRLAGVVGGLLLSDGLDAAAILSLVAADERPP